MDEYKKRILEALIGPELLAKQLATAEATQKAAEDAGLRYKGDQGRIDTRKLVAWLAADEARRAGRGVAEKSAEQGIDGGFMAFVVPGAQPASRQKARGSDMRLTEKDLRQGDGGWVLPYQWLE
jgi:hypothetical protein